MQPRTLLGLSTRAADASIVPNYLTWRDHPWLCAALEEHARFVGRRQSELRQRMREPLSTRAPKSKLRFVAALLETLGTGEAAAPVPPREARWAAFRAATARPFTREVVLASAAGELGVRAEELEASLFADLESERRVSPLPAELTPEGLALEANLMLVRAWLRRAVRVRIAAWGNTRALVRQAQLAGLLCVVRRQAPSESQEGIALEISGPFALFRHTELYGRALSALIPRALWCDRFELVADCALGRGPETAKLLVRSGDPIAVVREVGNDGRRLEARFERDFRLRAPDWEIVREPRAVEAGETLVFPDFELIHRREPERRWLLEIAGFWTPEYLAAKLQRLQSAGVERLVICIDERRGCSDSEAPEGARIVRYKNRIDPERVLSILRSG